VIELLIGLAIESDKPPMPPPVHVGELIWAFDTNAGMKIPLTVTKVYANGEWDGVSAWTWGMA
jgi:hypothetical protein